MERVRLRTTSEILYPVPVVLVTCQGLSGSPNIERTYRQLWIFKEEA
jgi:hypothetical protein